MSPERRTELRKLREAATPGEFSARQLVADAWKAQGMDPDDAECIAAAVNALVPLLDALDAAEENAETMRLAVQNVCAPKLTKTLTPTACAASVYQLGQDFFSMQTERDALAKRVAKLEGELMEAHVRNATEQDEHSAQRAELAKRVAELEGAIRRHRRSVWGCARTEFDMRLYAALKDRT